MPNDMMRPAGTDVDPYAAYASEISNRPFAGDLLVFSKHGDYKAGQSKSDIATGTKMVVYMPGLKCGWVKWQEKQPVQYVMGLVGDGFKPPVREELGDLDEDQWETLNDKPKDPWQMTNHLPMCDQKGQLFTFVSTSKGGLSEVGRIAILYANRRRMKPDEIPVIELHSDSYDHKIYGETMTPVFKVIGWVPIPTNFSELNEAVEDSSDETLVLEDIMEDEEPVRQVRKAAPQKPAPKTVSPKAPPPRSNVKASNGKRSPRL